MLCEAILGSVPDDADVDWVDLDYLQTTRRALRLRSRSGVKVDVLLPRGQTLRHGDVLCESPLVAVWVKPAAVLILRPATPAQAMTLAATLGNQHLPIEIDGDALITLDDGPTREIAADLDVAYAVELRRFHPNPRLMPPPVTSRL
jgi:urease accessory protein